MRLNPLRQKIADGKAVIGPILQEIPESTDLVEFLGRAGFDYVMIDGEHAGVGVAQVRELARAADAAGICALARVPDADPVRILAFLDGGIQGVILAHCNTAEDAEALVRATKYPPRGIRGAASGSRAAMFGYGPPTREKIDIADRETMCFGLVEEPRGVAEIGAMLKVDGFDGCFLGSGDMSLAMNRDYYGLPTLHPEVQKLMDQGRAEILAAGKLVMEPSGTCLLYTSPSPRDS